MSTSQMTRRHGRPVDWAEVQRRVVEKVSGAEGPNHREEIPGLVDACIEALQDEVALNVAERHLMEFSPEKAAVYAASANEFYDRGDYHLAAIIAMHGRWKHGYTEAIRNALGRAVGKRMRMKASQASGRGATED